jgi:hypothetical protein
MERLKYCDGRIGQAGPFGAKISDPSKARAIGVGTSMSTFQNGEPVPTPYTHIWVSFYGAAGDKDRFTLTSTAEIPEHYGIIDGKIMRDDAAAPARSGDASQGANDAPDPASCVKFARHYRDIAFDYMVFQNTCDRPYRVSAETRSGKVITGVLGARSQIQLQAIVSVNSLFDGRYEASEP